MCYSKYIPLTINASIYVQFTRVAICTNAPPHGCWLLVLHLLPQMLTAAGNHTYCPDKKTACVWERKMTSKMRWSSWNNHIPFLFLCGINHPSYLSLPHQNHLENDLHNTETSGLRFLSPRLYWFLSRCDCCENGEQNRLCAARLTSNMTGTSLTFYGCQMAW